MRAIVHTTLGIVLLSLLILSTSVAAASAQKRATFTVKDLPAAVTAAFQKSYPNAKIVGASKEAEKGKTLYEVESMDGTQRRDLLYTAKGEAVEIEEAIAEGALPDAVKETIGKKYAKAEVKKAERLTHGTVMEYEINLSSGKKSFEVVIKSDGSIVKSTEMNSKKKENEEEEED